VFSRIENHDSQERSEQPPYELKIGPDRKRLERVYAPKRSNYDAIYADTLL